MAIFLKKTNNKINEIISVSERKRLSVNFANFGLFQLINYVVPVITVPFIVRIIGPEKFGVISIAHALIYYIWIIVDYGYSISGVQLISQAQDDKSKCSQIVKNIFVIQILIQFLCFFALYFGLNLYEPLLKYKPVIFSYFLLIPANILLAAWFYTGIERVKYISVLSFFSRLIYIVLIFSLIRSQDDYILIPIFYSGSMLFGGLISLFIILRKFQLQFGKSITYTIISFLRRDKSIFFSTIFMNLYRNSNILILSFFTNEASVGIYSAGERIIKAIQAAFAPITQAFYPYISRITVVSKTNSRKIIKYMLIFMSLISGSVAALLLIFSGAINDIAFGENFNNTSIIIRITSPVILFGVINYIVGIIFMTNYSLKNEFTYSVTIIGVVNIFICSTLSHFYKEIGSAISFLIAEVLLLIVMIIYINIYKNRWEIPTVEK